MAASSTATVVFSAPVTVGGRTFASLALREPTVGDYLAIGGFHRRFRKGSVEADIALTPVPAIYLRRCALDCDEPGLLEALLDALPMADGLRLQRALQRLVPDLAREQVKNTEAAIAFEWRLMTIREADAMPISEFFYTAQRLGEHCAARDAAAREQQGSRRR